MLVPRSLTPKRLFIVGIVAALALSYLGAIRGYVSQRQDLATQQIGLSALIQERDAIRARLDSLQNPAIIEARARELGYTKPGELAVRVTDLELARPTPAPRDSGGGFWDFLPDIF